jgi:hypothetical protein
VPSTPERRSQQIFYVNGQFVPLTFAPPAEEQDPLLGIKTVAMQAVRGYQQALERKPITTKALTCFGGQILGDFIAQAATTGGFAAVGFDWHRSIALSSFAAIIGGPTGHFWHRFLEKRIGHRNPKGNRAVFTKLALDQAVMCPAINVVFLSWVHFLMHGGIVGTLLPFIGGSLPALLVANWKVWPIANTIAFRYIPQDLRIIYQNVLGVAMGTYVSLLTSGSLG